MLRPFIGDLPLEAIHMRGLQPFIEARRAQKVKNRTINYGLQTVRHILNMCAGEWIDGNGMTWLQLPPRIKFLLENDKRKPYPLSWAEQDKLFSELPDYLRKMALFKVNTGCREAEVCGLKWEWEQPYPPLNTSFFVIPAEKVKNREDRVVVLNRVADEVIEQARGDHPEHVFTYRGKPVAKMYGRAWKEARERAGLKQVRVHDLKHSYGRRLRAADVPEEDRKDLLGHKSGRSMTTHYSMAEIAKVIAYSNRVCRDERHGSDTIVFLGKKKPPGQLSLTWRSSYHFVVELDGIEPTTS
jgi:integrase